MSENHKSKKELRIGLIGFGNMGRVHAYAVSNLGYFYDSLPFDARISAVCTSHAESAEKAAAQCGAPAFFTDEDGIIASDADIIDVCTPNIYHYATVKKALAAGKHVLCEKPLCTKPEEADELASLAEKSGKICKVVFNNRFMLPVVRAKELIGEGGIGRILSFRAVYLHDSCVDVAKKAGWKQNADICGGGALFDLGSHVIDLVSYLCGRISTIEAMGQIAFPTRSGPDGKPWTTNADEAFYLLAKLENGACGTIEASKLATGTNDDLSIEIHGERGALRYSLMEPNWLYYYDSSAPANTRGFSRIECVGRYPYPGGGFPSPKAPVGWLRAHVGSMYSFLDSVCTGVPSGPDFADGAYIQRALAAAYRSAVSGRAENVL